MTCQTGRSGPAVAPYAAPVAFPWWDPARAGLCCVCAYRAIGASSYAASLVNLVNPGTYDLTTPHGPPAWTMADGWDIAGVNNLLTGYYPSNGGSYIARFSEGTTSEGVVLGGSIDNDGNFLTELNARHSVNTKRVWGQGLFFAEAGALASGIMAVANQRCFLNGAYRGNITADIGVWDSVSQMSIGSAFVEFWDFYTSYWSGKIQTVAIYDCALTDAQVLAVDTEMAALR